MTKYGLRVSALTLTLGLLGPSCTYPDLVVGDPPQGYPEPVCIWLISPRGFRANGSTSKILDHENDRTGTACLCLTQEDYDGLGDRLKRLGFPEPGTLLEEFNEAAYDECKRLSSVDPDNFVDDECRDYYEAGEWLKDIYFHSDDYDGAPPGFTCYE